METCRDPESPAFTRAGAMLALRRFMSEASFDEARRNLDANDSVVRVAAVSKLEDLSDAEAHRALTPVLKDPIRSVRTEAARILARVPETLFSDSDLNLFHEVFEELKLRYTSNLDRPEAHLADDFVRRPDGFTSRSKEGPRAVHVAVLVLHQRRLQQRHG